MIRIPGKIPILIHPLFWALAGFIGWLSSQSVVGTLLWIVVILYSVLFHELGHALTALYFGQKADITLYIAGGATSRQGGRLKLWQEFFVTLNGPLFGLFLFFIALKIVENIQNIPSALLYMLHITIFVNLYWTLINLLPVQPLDGGRLLSVVLEGLFGVRGIKISYFIGMVLAAAVSALFFIFGFLLPGSLFLLLTFESFQIWKNSLHITHHDKDDGLQESMQQAEEALGSGDLEEASERLKSILEKTEHGVLHLAATQYLADIYVSKQQIQEAYDLLKPHESKLDQEHTYLLYRLANQIKDWKTVTALGDRMYQNNPNYETAAINAIAYAALKEVRPAIGWLKCAKKSGFPNLQELLGKTEFDSIRPAIEDLKW